MTRISAIVPALNEAAHIAATLDDLAPLRSAGHELILVDGGSRDGTPDLASGRVDLLLHTPPGRATQMNQGAEAARGEVLWFIHADTRIPPPALQSLYEAVAANRPWGRFDIRLSGTRPLLRMVEQAMNLRSRLSGIATGDQGIFVTTAAFHRIGGFPDQPLMEDIALSTRLRALAPPACLRPPLITSSRRWERDGTIRTILLMWRLRLAYALGADPHILVQRYYG